MADIVLHPSTKRLIDATLQRPVHGLLLKGEAGTGLLTIARHMARGIGPSNLIQEVMPDEKGTIPIEVIRKLYTLTRTKRDETVCIIIDDADSMGIEAQNALLKLLEEPGAHIMFILTTHRPQDMLPTIMSRTRHIDVLPVSRADTLALITSGDETVRNQLLFLGSGLPAEIIRLQSDDSYFAKRTQIMKDARLFLAGDTYERLTMTKTYGGDRTQASVFLSSLSKLLNFMLLNKEQLSYAPILQTVETVQDRLARNGHIKTQLAYLVTNMAA